MKPAAIDIERQRQRQLLAALNPGTAATTAPVDARLAGQPEHGLRAYRANARAAAERALGAAFPTLLAMLGADNFAALARDHWRDATPERGDLGEWGAALPVSIEAYVALAEWPWLADAARLDWALHVCERAEDAVLDAASLHALADTDPARLRLEWLPGTTLLESRWPIARLHSAHRQRGGDAATEAALADARTALAAGIGEAVLVGRVGWRAVVHPVDAGELPWLRAIDAGRNLATAFVQAGDDFDFTAWLTRALAAGWLKGVAVVKRSLPLDGGGSLYPAST